MISSMYSNVINLCLYIPEEIKNNYRNLKIIVQLRNTMSAVSLFYVIENELAVSNSELIQHLPAKCFHSFYFVLV